MELSSPDADSVGGGATDTDADAVVEADGVAVAAAIVVPPVFLNLWSSRKQALRSASWDRRTANATTPKM